MDGGDRWAARARGRRRAANTLATIAVWTIPIALLCLIGFNVLASRWYPPTDGQDLFIGSLVNAGWGCCLAAAMLGLLSLVIGTDHRARAVGGIVGGVLAVCIGVVLVTPAAL